ncbi:MAG: aminoglycoside 6-adenylyltransferase [Thermoleophilia bacterium]|nr:aminoglycoside 6-adenylyltransferase [Thermoleophilia bacterium]
MHPKYNETINQLKTWAQNEKSIQGVIILGSQVRAEFEGDEWSDLDVLLLADTPSDFMQSDNWLDFFGNVVCVVNEETPLDWVNMTWAVKRVLFTDNRAVDFSILPSDRVDDVLSMNAEIHAFGYEIIYDAHPNMLTVEIETSLVKVKKVKEELPKPPTEPELQQIINNLLFELIFAAKKIKRNELWVAVSAINQQINNRLLQLIEFHTTSVAKPSQGIRYDGRFLEQRIPQATLEKLPLSFAKYDVFDAIQTIEHLLEITYCLSKEICEEQNYLFEAEQFYRTRKLFDEVFEDERM